MGKNICWFFILALATSAAQAQSNERHSNDLKPYPAAEAGYQRQVIRLPAVSDPESYKVELAPGKLVTLDCNRQMIRGVLEQQTAKGWGYDYYTLKNIGAAASTLMACPPDSRKENEFVRITTGNRNSGETWLRYNAKLPIVVYVPEDVELRYRIWHTSETMKNAGME